MDRVVLDSSVLLKAIFKPFRSLTKDIYFRELETHSKCQKIIDIIYKITALSQMLVKNEFSVPYSSN
jgi:predicted nucleic acid-binding protein